MAELVQVAKHMKEPRCDPTTTSMNLGMDGERTLRGNWIWSRWRRSWTEVGDQGGRGGEPADMSRQVV
jgi:hypothetical protein